MAIRPFHIISQNKILPNQLNDNTYRLIALLSYRLKIFMLYSNKKGTTYVF